jgi:hypothetical protein
MTGVAELRVVGEVGDDKTELCGHPTSRTSCRTTCMIVLSYDKFLRVDRALKHLL